MKLRAGDYERDPESGLLLPRRELRARPQWMCGPAFFGAGGIDSYFANVTVGLHFDGTDGDTTTTDIKGNTVTRAGTPTISNLQSKFGGTSAKVNGSQSWKVAAGAGIQMGAGDFTIECWLYPTTLGTTLDFLNNFDTGATSSGFAIQCLNASGGLQAVVYSGATSYPLTGANGSLVVNTWQHIEFDRSGTNLYLFVNGTQVATSATIGSNAMNASTQPLFIGAEGNAGTSFGIPGYIDDVRVTKGVARHTANFTAPTAAFPNS
jgi:hypothetical protein